MSDIFKINHPLQLKCGQGIQELVLDDDIALDLSGRYAQFLSIDCGGAARSVDLPQEVVGAWFEILNASDAAETISFYDSTGETLIGQVDQNEKGMLLCISTGWKLFSVSVIALS